MTATDQNDSASNVASQALQWFIELQGAVLREQQQAFGEWLCRSPTHIEEFLRLTELHGAVQRMPEIKDLDVEELLERLDLREVDDHVVQLSTHRLDAADGPAGLDTLFSKQPPKALLAICARSRRRKGLAVCAAFSLTFGLIFASLWRYGPLQDYLIRQRYTTETSEQLSLTLADGSQVQLNARSSLGATVNTRVRKLWLSDGEALFNVAKDPMHPFRVNTPQATIEAKGTQFNVEMTGDTTVVSLIKGRVLVSCPHWTPILLRPGEQISIASNDLAPPKPHLVDMKTVTAWTEHRLIFEDAPLWAVILEFNRYSALPFIIEDPSLRDVRITASFDTDSVRSFAASLVAAGNLRITQQPSGAYLIERE